MYRFRQPMYRLARARIFKRLWSPGIDFLDFLKIQAQATLAGGIDSLESIAGLLKRLQIRAQFSFGSVLPLGS